MTLPAPSAILGPPMALPFFLRSPASLLLRRPAGPIRLHVGSGEKRIHGWINVDIKRLHDVDVVADATKTLRFTDVDAIFAEHFLEHLRLDQALDFLVVAHRALRRDGWIRLSTPNLDWVLETHYRPRDREVQQREMALEINRAFRGWGHQFLWNREMLAEVLEVCGFAGLRWCLYGESDLPVFLGLERHDAYEDLPELRHVLIVEATKGVLDPERLAAYRRGLHETYTRHVEADH